MEGGGNVVVVVVFKGLKKQIIALFN